MPLEIHRSNGTSRLLQVPPRQQYFRQQSYSQYHNPPQFPESDTKEPIQNSGPPAPSGPAKTTTPPVPKTRPPPPPDFHPLASAYWPCRQHGVVDCDECLLRRTPTTHHCQALIAIYQDCGRQHPFIADACQSDCKDINMPVVDGLLEEQPVQVLRDTGCSAVIVRGSLVSETKLTGQEAKCVLSDGTIRRAPVVQVFRDTPYLPGPSELSAWKIRCTTSSSGISEVPRILLLRNQLLKSRPGVR